MKPLIALRLFACLALLCVCTPVLAKPALWVAKDADTTIYLFGTVHLLPNDTAWRSPALEEALAQSSALYIEVTDDDQPNMIALVLKYGMDPTHPLTDQLNPTELRQLQVAAEHANLPGDLQTLRIMRPWLAALTLTAAPLLKAGIDPKHGVDKQLKAQMLAAGKPVLGLETAEQQIRLLADMPEPMQLAFLRTILHDIDKSPAEFARLIDAWKRGDVGSIARLEDQVMRAQNPKLYQRLLVQRNLTWARRIAALMRHPGTLFIAVGAAHLAGPDSVQAQLKLLGVPVERLP